MHDRNYALLEDLRDRLISESTSHNQGAWAKVVFDFPKGLIPQGVGAIQVSCASSMCAAGATCLLAGDEFLITPYDYEPDYDDDGNEIPFYQAGQCIDEDGEQYEIPFRARDLLGLTNEEASIFFHPDHSQVQTLELLDRLIEGKEISYYPDDNQYWSIWRPF